MKGRSIGFGIFILSIGVIWILFNLGIINWSILDALYRLWPLIFVVIGINVIFRNNSIVRGITWLAFLAAIISYGYFFPNVPATQKPGEGGNVSIEMPAETKRGELDLELGGVNLDVASTSARLVEAFVSDPDINHSVGYGNGKETATIRFNKKNRFAIYPGSVNSQLKVNLNENVLWNMNVKTGAVKGMLDLSRLRVENLKVDAGAAKLDFVFGRKSENFNVRLNAGASDIGVTVPSGSGVRIRMDGALNGTNLNELGWEKQGKVYTSPGYDSAPAKIDMEVKMGVGHFTVKVDDNMV